MLPLYSLKHYLYLCTLKPLILSIMVTYFKKGASTVYAVESDHKFTDDEKERLSWLLGGARPLSATSLKGTYIGPRKEMITPWSTNAVEITQNMGLTGITRIEEFLLSKDEAPAHDKMLQRVYDGLNSRVFKVEKTPDPIVYIDDISEYNRREGLALSLDEENYLRELAAKLGRKLTDSEVFGFSQVNSEHCRHKIFNGTFVIDGEEKPMSLFKLIKKTSQVNPNRLVSAYKDNVAFIEGPAIDQFYPINPDSPDYFETKKIDTVISLKAETHNFPTTVEPFNGAATGSGGEIRDRLGGGMASLPIAGTAVYMTSYPRMTMEHSWELMMNPRVWLYQTPAEILIKASNGASDFGNKFGQPLICGSLLTFEHDENGRQYAYDKVIMLAGGVGYAKQKDALKAEPGVGDKVVLLGGDNYRIGMGGGAVSSVNTGQYANAIELNAIQRSNPEMQKRAYNAIRSVAESDNNTIISVHDHGAGGHLNCLSELVEQTGGNIDISKLPVGDPTLSLKEIIGNESQERMGLVMEEKDIANLKAIADRERAPMYVIGETSGKHNFTLKNEKTGEAAIDLQIEDMFGSAPKTYMHGDTADYKFKEIEYEHGKFEEYLQQVLQLESVACKDWLTNKVDRSVTGLIAGQQCTGEIQLPLNNLGVTAIGYNNKEGIATSLGHAPLVALANPDAGSRMAIAEALTNVVWAPLKGGLKGISLSANWMWPCRNTGEDARLYRAVKGASDFAISLGINIPTGKDSMSMTQSYPNGEKVLSPGTLIISTVAPVENIYNIVKPDLKESKGSRIIYIPFTKGADGNAAFNLAGSAFAQITGQVGSCTPDVKDSGYFADCFAAVQELVSKELVLAGHDISAGGLITALLEMCFANAKGGIKITASPENGKELQREALEKIMFAEDSGVLIQVAENNLTQVLDILNGKGYVIGETSAERCITIDFADAQAITLDIDRLRDIWYKTSYLFDIRQVGEECAKERFQNYKKQPLVYSFPKHFTGELKDCPALNSDKQGNRENANAPVAAIIREKGSNGDREMAWALFMAGFKVKDVHMTDLISGRETLEDVQMIVFVGGFSNADTLGSAKGWAGAFLYNAKAKSALDKFYARKDTLSLGVCNGCQLMAELGLVTPQEKQSHVKMLHNNSHKYESGFVGVTIEDSPSVLLESLKGSKLGIWVAHGEGKFSFPKGMEKFNVAIRYTYNGYPANPNGSPEGTAGVCSTDGRHLAMMPHPERCLRPWNWAHYTEKNHTVTPWVELFINGRKWCEKAKIQ